MLKIELYSHKTETLVEYVNAKIEDKCLTIEGHDMGASVEQFWGEDEYEYWYKFNKENTAKLRELLTKSTTTSDTDFLEALKKEFPGKTFCKDFSDYCLKNDVKYKLSNYV